MCLGYCVLAQSQGCGDTPVRSGCKVPSWVSPYLGSVLISKRLRSMGNHHEICTALELRLKVVGRMVDLRLGSVGSAKKNAEYPVTFKF